MNKNISTSIVFHYIVFPLQYGIVLTNSFASFSKMTSLSCLLVHVASNEIHVIVTYISEPEVYICATCNYNACVKVVVLIGSSAREVNHSSFKFAKPFMTIYLSEVCFKIQVMLLAKL